MDIGYAQCLRLIKYSEAKNKPNMLVYSSAPIAIEKTESELMAGFIGFPSSVEIGVSSAGPVEDTVSSDSEEVGEFCCEAASDFLTDSVVNGFISG
jgi:hypothetical protein